MKKLFLTIAIVLGGLTAMNAQAKDLKSVSQDKNTVPDKENVTERKQDLSTKKTTELSPATNQQPVKAAPQVYQKVEHSKVPAPVQQEIAKKHKGSKISTASVNSAGIYKVELIGADKTQRTIYVDKNGKEIKDDLKQ
ncbi:MAG TPA: hypothetical protein VFF21_03150 [Flavobacteriaceae bacterium]|nr:hypothetical protein [Flavobacteriaceae bacterium]